MDFGMGKFLVVGLLVLVSLRCLEQGSELICDRKFGLWEACAVLGIWGTLGLVTLGVICGFGEVSLERLGQFLGWMGVGVLGMSVGVGDWLVRESGENRGALLGVTWVLRVMWWIGGLGLMWWVR